MINKYRKYPFDVFSLLSAFSIYSIYEYIIFLENKLSDKMLTHIYKRRHRQKTETTKLFASIFINRSVSFHLQLLPWTGCWY